MRLREIYTLESRQVDLRRRTVFVDVTENGSKRQVPLSGRALEVIKRCQEQVASGERGMAGFKPQAGLLFQWWDARPESLNRTTTMLSHQFARAFAAAGCEDLRFHDPRHEATSRIYERTTLSDLQIAKITGHEDLKMLSRYANLRGSDLAERLWWRFFFGVDRCVGQRLRAETRAASRSIGCV